MQSDVVLANWIATGATCSTATLMIILSIPMIQENVKPNRVYGFRTRKTLSDPRIWYSANRVMGKDMLIAGAVVLAVAVMLIISDRIFVALPVAILDVAALVAALGISMAHGFWSLSKM